MKNNKPKRFFFHYNKPASMAKGKPQIYVHFNNACHIVDNILCRRETESKVNWKTSPKFVMQGFANNIYIDKSNTAVID